MNVHWTFSWVCSATKGECTGNSVHSLLLMAENYLGKQCIFTQLFNESRFVRSKVVAALPDPVAVPFDGVRIRKGAKPRVCGRKSVGAGHDTERIRSREKVKDGTLVIGVNNIAEPL